MIAAGAAAAPAAHADDPLAPIVSAVSKDRQKACHDVAFPPSFGTDFNYSRDLEAVAQEYARSEKTPGSPPAGYQSLMAFLGAGDPEAQAINRAYQHGAGQEIGRCSAKDYGVGFVRRDDRSVAVVTIVFGVLKPAPPPPVSDFCRKPENRNQLVCGGVK